MNAREDLNRLRAKLDLVDEELLGLMNQRKELGIEIGQLKHQNAEAGPIRQPERERSVLHRLENLNAERGGILTPADLKILWGALFTVSRNAQEKQVTIPSPPD